MAYSENVMVNKHGIIESENFYLPVLGSICTGGIPMCAGGGDARCSLLYIISDVNAPGWGGCNGCLLP